jgi:hypothetical protein
MVARETRNGKMRSVKSRRSLVGEFADFLASGPSPTAILQWRPSKATQNRMSKLLELQDDDALGPEDRQELENALQAELMLRALKARLTKSVSKRA